MSVNATGTVAKNTGTGAKKFYDRQADLRCRRRRGQQLRGLPLIFAVIIFANMSELARKCFILSAVLRYTYCR